MWCFLLIRLGYAFPTRIQHIWCCVFLTGMSGGTWCPSAPHQGCPLSSHGESAVQLLFSAAVVLPLWLVNSLWTLEDHENILLIIRISLEIWTSMKDSCLNFITIVTHWWWSTLALSARFPVRMWYSTVTKNAPVGRLRGSVVHKISWPSVCRACLPSYTTKR